MSNSFSNVMQKVRIALGLEEESSESFAVETVLIDGTSVSAEALEPGNTLYMTDADGNKVACSEGTYETSDMLITVDSNGVISDIISKTENAETETVENAETETVENAETETVENAETEIETETETEVDPQIQAIMDVVAALVDKVNSLEEKLGSMGTQMSEVEEKFSSLPGAPRIKNTASEKGPLTPEEARIERLKAISGSIKN